MNSKLSSISVCVWHLCENHLSGRQKKFCSVKCKNKDATSRKRRNNKKVLVDEHGGLCVDCGFSGPPFIFDFDHRDPDSKSFGIAEKGETKSLEELRLETIKCDLVCSNCHRMRAHIQRCTGCEYCIIAQ